MKWNTNWVEEAKSIVKKIYVILSLAVGMIASLICLFMIFQNPKTIVVVMTAEVLENRGNVLVVSSYSGSHGKYSVSTGYMENEEAVFDKDGNKISMSDIPEGSMIKIEYGGSSLEASPAIMIGIIKIEIIEMP